MKGLLCASQKNEVAGLCWLIVKLNCTQSKPAPTCTVTPPPKQCFTWTADHWALLGLAFPEPPFVVALLYLISCLLSTQLGSILPRRLYKIIYFSRFISPAVLEFYVLLRFTRFAWTAVESTFFALLYLNICLKYSNRLALPGQLSKVLYSPRLT
jgi:hypothetical protein